MHRIGSAVRSQPTSLTPRLERSAHSHSQQAAILVGKKMTRVQSVELPQPGCREVRVKLQGCGISGWHVPIWEGRSGARYPLEAGAPGHEGWGFVDAVGPGIEDLEVGDRVAVASGHAYAQFDIASRDCVVPLPEELDDEPFPGEAFADAMTLFERSDVRQGHVVAIVGAELLGLLLTQLLYDQGAHPVVLSRRSFELELADSMDAEATVLLRNDGTDVERALSANGGDCFDRVIQIDPTRAALDLARQLCGERAHLVSGSDWRSCHGEPARYVGGVQRAIQAALEGWLDPFPLMSHSVSMHSLDRGFELTRSRPEGFVKALLLHEH